MRPAHWLPPVLWMGLILWLSSDAGSTASTAGVVLPFLRWLAPWATDVQLDAAHGLVRKSAHVVEYAVLVALWFRACTRGPRLSSRAAARVAASIALAWAFLDEAHQSTLLSRTGSAADVALDGAGALAALIVASRGWRVTLDLATGAGLWVAAVGGAGVLVVDLLSGVGATALWLTVPAAALVLLLRRRGRMNGPVSSSD